MALGEFYELGGWVGEGCEGSVRPTFSRGMYEVCGALEYFSEPGSDGGVVGGMLLLIANVFLVPCRFQLACRVDDQ